MFSQKSDTHLISTASLKLREFAYNSSNICCFTITRVTDITRHRDILSFEQKEEKERFELFSPFSFIECEVIGEYCRGYQLQWEGAL